MNCYNRTAPLEWSSWLYGEEPLNRSAHMGRHGLLSRESSASGDPSVVAVKQTHANASVHYKWKVGLNYWCRHLTCASSIPAVLDTASVRLAAATNDRCPNWMHSPLLIIRWDFFFSNIWVITSYAQQIRRHTCSKPQTKFLLRHNLASHFKMAPSPKEQPFNVCSPVSHSERSFYSNLILAE